MPTREQVRGLLDSGLDYQAAGQRLGIPPGQAYLIATGVPADGSETIGEEEGRFPGFLPSSQHLANPPHDNPETEDAVAAWLSARVAADEQMRTAMRQRTPEPPETDPELGKDSHEQPMVPAAQFTSYYGKPVLNAPVWASPDIPGYLFLGGLAGGSSLLAAGADLTGRTVLGKVTKTGAAAASLLSLAALIHDLGQPARFLHMLRVFKVTSPMSVGTWLLSAYVPTAGVAAVSALTGRLRWIGYAATAGAALLAPAVASYTAALISDTAVPSWHDGYPEMPFVFTGSGAMAAGALGLLSAPLAETAPARNLALLGAAMETAALERMERRIGLTAEPYSGGRGGGYVKAGKVLAAAGAAGALLSTPGLLPGQLLSGRGGRVAAALSGAALITASAATRWGIFHAGLASAADPKYTVVPQRQRLSERAPAGPAG